MSRALQLCVITWYASGSLALLCYNCSTTHMTATGCAGDFSPTPMFRQFNDSAEYLVNCSSDNAMCFVRSWQARAKYAWIVQRGCYHSSGRNDSLPKLLNMPTRAMSCTHRRFSEAEYRVCLCRADWCNLASSLVQSHYFIAFISIIVYLLSF